MSNIPHVTLNNDVSMPQLGFGVFQVPDADTEPAVTTAIEVGYRSIDTARIYGNEEGTGRAIKSCGVPREELFVTTKLWNADHGYDSTLRACEASLDRLGLDHVDLYLIHWPMPTRDRYLDTWRAFERLLADGRARAIGVSNFLPEHLTRLMDAGDVVPAVNQIELHPYLQQTELRDFHAEHGIVTEGWSPLGQGQGLLDDPQLTSIAAKHGKTPAQVALRWQLQLGNVVIPKSVTPSRIAENFAAPDFELDADDLAAIAALDRGKRYGPDPATFDYTG
jgi:2,5-diketo-D-gluconate reductase A